MMNKVETFEYSDLGILQNDLNLWFKNTPNIKLIDIKYTAFQVSPIQDRYTAMVIYEES